MQPIERPSRPKLSIVIPAYNEAGRLGRTLETAADHFGERAEDVEIIVVDDGSSDATPEVAKAAAERRSLKLRVLSHRPNRGKGYAIRRGMLEARGDAVLFMDADLAVPIEYADRFVELLSAGNDVVIGSRRVRGANIAIHQPWIRERLGTWFRDLARLLLVPGISDFTCGFKAFRGDVAREVFSRQRVTGWGFDVECVLIASRLGYRVVEAPVEWRDDGRTRVRLMRDIPRSALDLLTILWNDLRGRYRPTV
ncbi:MAG: dolichyl-phosphate beta-glucosyltransferase [Myxococcota bacterium]